MKPEKQRIAIAEACGWKAATRKIKHYDTYCHPDGRRVTFVQLPHYIKDLNAMHDAVNILFQKRLGKVYGIELYKIVDRDTATEDCSMSDCIDDPVEIAAILSQSTAAQRAEAFLRTLKLWEE